MQFYFHCIVFFEAVMSLPRFEERGNRLCLLMGREKNSALDLSQKAEKQWERSDSRRACETRNVVVAIIGKYSVP